MIIKYFYAILRYINKRGNMIRAFSILIYFVMGVTSVFTGLLVLYFMWFAGEISGGMLYVIVALLFLLGFVSLYSAIKKKFLFRKRFVILSYFVLALLLIPFTEKNLSPEEYIVSPKVLNLRQGAGKNFPVIGKLKSGNVVKVVDSLQGGWMFVQTNNKQGYVYGKYLSKEKWGNEKWLYAGLIVIVGILIGSRISPPPLLKVSQIGLIVYKRPLSEKEYKDNVQEAQARLTVLGKNKYFQKTEGITFFTPEKWVKIRIIDPNNPYNRKAQTGYIRKAKYLWELKRNKTS